MKYNTKIRFIGFGLLYVNASITFTADNSYECYKESQEVVNHIQSNFSHSLNDAYFALERCAFYSKRSFEGFLLKDIHATYHAVDSNDVLGHGNSKKAVLLVDGLLIPPTLNVDSCVHRMKLWEDCVAESAMGTFLEKIIAPDLNRQKVFLKLPTKQNPDVSYEPPKLVPDPFNAYAKKMCLMMNRKRDSLLSPWNNYNYAKRTSNDFIFKDNKEKLTNINGQVISKYLKQDMSKLITSHIKAAAVTDKQMPVKNENIGIQKKPVLSDGRIHRLNVKQYRALCRDSAFSQRLPFVKEKLSLCDKMNGSNINLPDDDTVYWNFTC